MHVLFAASECFPFVKIGGLADVVGGLPKALRKLGLEVAIAIPKYEVLKVPSSKYQVLSQPALTVRQAGGEAGIKGEEVTIYQDVLPQSDIPVYFLENRHYLSSGSIYANQEFHPREEIERFVFFSKAVVEFTKNFDIDIVHCHDWHTSLVPLFLKSSPSAKTPKTILTIHNLGKAYQGTSNLETMKNFGIDSQRIVKKNDETKVNILLQGIMYSDLVTTVSPTYAQEIKTKEFGEGLETYLLKRSESLYGILNGIDTQVWNPITDQVIPFPYSNRLSVGESKKLNAQVLFTQLGMNSTGNEVIIGMVTRVAEQKGFDILLPILDELLQNVSIKLIILGVGDNVLEKSLEKIATEHEQNFRYLKRFDEYFAHLIYASSQLFLMPSRFEPSGIGQLIAMNYGTLPVVRKVGGLADSVTDGKTGFVFEEYQSEALFTKLKEAVNLVKTNQELYETMVQEAIQRDFSWEKSGEEYLKLYRKLLI